MAQSSGKVTGDLPAGSFLHARYQYRIARSSLELEKESVKAHWRLSYFVGSGAMARSYLLEADGFLFEAPVAYYAAGRKWDLAPGYGAYNYPFLARSIQAGCLSCHATGVDPVPGTQSRFRSPPFHEGGIGCERCHGPGSEHIATRRNIVNPAKLPPDRRDSICAQCHLQGEVRVMRPGKDWGSYQPGGRLADSMTVFVRAGAGLKVTSHGERLAQSRCKQSAGDRLWCGSCHDPHSLPKPAERVSWFRTKCLACHETRACRETLAARRKTGSDCTACHMPRNPVVDAQHVVYTDHAIPRRAHSAPAASGGDLVPFAGGAASDRDIALAYAITAGRDKRADHQSRAVRMLAKVERENPDDVEVLLYLAELYRNTAQTDAAIPLFERAIRLDPSQVTASVGLGAIHMERGDAASAIRLWQDALSKNAGLLLVRTNLAAAYLRRGDRRLAESTLRQTLDLNPGFPPAMELLERLKQ